MIYNSSIRQRASLFCSETAQLIHKAIRKINDIATALFKAIRKVFLFPTRYVGAKDWSIFGLIKRWCSKEMARYQGSQANVSDQDALFGSGYHRFSHRNLTSEEIKPLILFACAAAAIHSNNLQWITPFEYNLKDIDSDLKIENRTNCFFDEETGLKFAAYENERQILIAFGALGSSDSELDSDSQKAELRDKVYRNSVLNLLGGKQAIYLKADRIISKLLKTEPFQNKEVLFVGQSLAGSIASYVALKNNRKAICLNSLPLGAGLQQEIGRKYLMDADKHITHIIIKDDYLSDTSKILGVIDAIASFFGLRTAGNFGIKNRLPSAYSRIAENHNYVLGSMLAHAGFDKHSKPWLLADDPRFAELKPLFTDAIKNLNTRQMADPSICDVAI
jgi:hypothetical protein